MEKLVLWFAHFLSFLSLSVLGTCNRICCDVLNLLLLPVTHCLRLYTRVPLLNSHCIRPAENGPSRTYKASVTGLCLDTSLRKLSKSSALWSAKGNSALKFSQNSRQDAEFQEQGSTF